MNRQFPFLSVLVTMFVAFVAMGCGPSSQSSSAQGDRDVLTAEEIATTNAYSAYDAVRIRRPEFLQMRIPKSMALARQSLPTLYVNGMQLGDLQGLKDIPARDVHEIRYSSPSNAQLRYGVGHVGGILEVLTRK